MTYISYHIHYHIHTVFSNRYSLYLDIYLLPASMDMCMFPHRRTYSSSRTPPHTHTNTHTSIHINKDIFIVLINYKYTHTILLYAYIHKMFITLQLLPLYMNIQNTWNTCRPIFNYLLTDIPNDSYIYLLYPLCICHTFHITFIIIYILSFQIDIVYM